MNRLSEFFQYTHNDSGVFYPNHYLVAFFSSLAEADSAKQDVNHAGLLAEHVISVPGEELVHYAEARLLKDGLWGVLLTELSRTIGPDPASSDRGLVPAKSGAAFVAVRCSNQTAKATAWKSLETTHPLAAHYYSAGGVEQLAGEIM